MPQAKFFNDQITNLLKLGIQRQPDLEQNLTDRIVKLQFAVFVIQVIETQILRIVRTGIDPLFPLIFSARVFFGGQNTERSGFLLRVKRQKRALGLATGGTGQNLIALKQLTEAQEIVISRLTLRHGFSITTLLKRRLTALIDIFQTQVNFRPGFHKLLNSR
ncbi:MAG: hypothetical protein COW02_05195 [Comamonadaceae bacterium CG12_big_fil_rev_8_21_14_0_65_59_15]|nr:MAG: hypothetical protein COW02_05195 [Comamonadaceae bacterium CG12_big_fil_rev_8_21_14_0_65_59_15]